MPASHHLPPLLSSLELEPTVRFRETTLTYLSDFLLLSITSRQETPAFLTSWTLPQGPDTRNQKSVIPLMSSSRRLSILTMPATILPLNGLTSRGGVPIPASEKVRRRMQRTPQRNTPE